MRMFHRLERDFGPVTVAVISGLIAIALSVTALHLIVPDGDLRSVAIVSVGTVVGMRIARAWRTTSRTNRR